MQEAKAEGQKAVFNAQEQRDQAQLDRYSNLATGEGNQKRADSGAAIGSLVGIAGAASKLIKP